VTTGRCADVTDVMAVAATRRSPDREFTHGREPAISITTIPARGATPHASGAATLGLMNLLPSTDAPMTPEERIDTALAESFPASDPPWLSLGVPSLRLDAQVTEPAAACSVVRRP
jgi:hypothetical protein